MADRMTSPSRAPPPTVPLMRPSPWTIIFDPDVRGVDPLWATTVATTTGSPRSRHWSISVNRSVMGKGLPVILT
jgi:hypothetical protein